MEVRAARKSDFVRIAELDREVWLDYPNGQNLVDGEHTWRHWVDDALVHVLIHDGVIAGAVIAFPKLKGGFWVHKIFVAKALRAKGGGRRLFESILTAIDKHKADCTLTVNPANEHAARLYRSLGFKAEQIIQGYYRENEHRYEMRRIHSDVIENRHS